MTTIPNWNAQGVIPPIDPLRPTSPDRSPYVVSLAEVTQRFATSPERIAILRGFLEYRAALHHVGLTDGFQWLDGSFLENKEMLRGEPPGDIDVVTFYRLPANTSEPDLDARGSSLFNHNAVKIRFHVDSYFQPLYIQSESLIIRSSYWYGMWSHQRDNFGWKGFLQVTLSSEEDASALAILTPLSGGATL